MKNTYVEIFYLKAFAGASAEWKVTFMLMRKRNMGIGAFKKIRKRLVSCCLAAALLLPGLSPAKAVEAVSYHWGEAQAIPGREEGISSGEGASEGHLFFSPAPLSKASQEGSFYRQLNGRQKSFYDMLNSLAIGDICRAEEKEGYRLLEFRLSSASSLRLTGSFSSSGQFVPSGAARAQINALYTDLLAAIEAFRYDVPEAFWASSMQYGYYWRRESSTAVRVTSVTYGFRLLYGGREPAMYETMMSRAHSLAAEIAPLPDTYSRVKAAHDILAATNVYASGAAKDNKIAHCAYSALVPNDGYDPVCDGYSKAFKVLCDLLGIPCVLVISDTHMWNLVQMDDGAWYYVDVTWDDQPFGVNWNYFLIGSQSRVNGVIFSQEKEHRAVSPYQKRQGYGEVNLSYPNASREAYSYLGADYPSTAFPDVKWSDWYCQAVEEAYSLGLIFGDSNGYFRPAKPITRAEFAQVMANSLKADLSLYRETTFADVAGSAWYAPAVAWAEERGIMKGHQGRFRPSDPISREEMCMVFYQLFSPEAGSFVPEPPFEDAEAISSWAKAAVAYCASLGLVRGDGDGNVKPRSNTLRREAAVLFVRYAQLL